MRSGILNGYGSLCDGIVQRIQGLLKKSVKVIATGGDAAIIAKHSKSVRKIDPDLTLKGLQITAEQTKL